MNKTVVILVSYKGYADTLICLDSLTHSTLPVDVVLVDTTPNDPELDTIAVIYPQVTVLRAQSNVGFGRGNNLGIAWALRHTSCDYLFLLNNDASVLPQSIQVLEEAFVAMPHVGVLTPRIAYRDDPSKLWYGGGDIDWRRGSSFTPGINESVHAPLALKEREVTFASGCALFVRRSVMEAVGGFDARFFMYEEDVEWCLRAHEKEVVIRYLPSSLILHRAQGSSRGEEGDRSDFWSVRNPRLSFYAFHIIRNRLLNIFTYARGWNIALVLCFFPLYIIRRAIPFLRGRRGDAVLAMFKGAMDAWRCRRIVSTELLTEQEPLGLPGIS